MDRFPQRFALASIALLSAVACASVPAPVDRIQAAKQAIGVAERSGAHEDAPLELYVARERLENAQQAMAKEDFVAARRLADDASVYAELARTKALAAQNQRDADELRTEVDVIESDHERRQRP